jgi:hypothetical protein
MSELTDRAKAAIGRVLQSALCVGIAWLGASTLYDLVRNAIKDGQVGTWVATVAFSPILLFFAFAGAALACVALRFAWTGEDQ